MDARSRPTTRSLAENTSSVATGARPTDRPFGELGEKVAKAAARRGSYRPTALVLTIAGPSCPLFPASMRVWKLALWTCASLRLSIWGALLVPARSCITCHALLISKRRRFPYLGQAEPSGKSCTSMAVSSSRRRSRGHWSLVSALWEIQMDFKDGSLVL